MTQNPSRSERRSQKPCRQETRSKEQDAESLAPHRSASPLVAPPVRAPVRREIAAIQSMELLRITMISYDFSMIFTRILLGN